jgi:hypothetical protein
VNTSVFRSVVSLSESYNSRCRMRFSIAAGILSAAVTLPLLEADESHAMETKYLFAARHIDTVSNSGFAGAKLPKRFRESRTFHGRKNQGRRLVEKECVPASFDADVGILACGLGQHCEASANSKLGGVCRRISRFEEEKVNYNNNYYYYEFIPSYVCSMCDCSQFDYAANMGDISCGPFNYCFMDCDPPVCLSYTMEFHVVDATKYTVRSCRQFDGDAYDFALCYGSGDYSGSFYVDDVKCNNVTYAYNSESNNICFVFDCTNTVKNLAGNTCEGDILLPEMFYDSCAMYPNFPETYKCRLCDVGSYVLIADGVIGEETCADVDLAAENGLISVEDCAIQASLVEANCGCKVAEIPPNDMCNEAVPLSPSSGELIVGTTRGSTLDTFESC